MEHGRLCPFWVKICPPVFPIFLIPAFLILRVRESIPLSSNFQVFCFTPQHNLLTWFFFSFSISISFFYFSIFLFFVFLFFFLIDFSFLRFFYPCHFGLESSFFFTEKTNFLTPIGELTPFFLSRLFRYPILPSKLSSYRRHLARLFKIKNKKSRPHFGLVPMYVESNTATWIVNPQYNLLVEGIIGCSTWIPIPRPWNWLVRFRISDRSIKYVRLPPLEIGPVVPVDHFPLPHGIDP